MAEPIVLEEVEVPDNVASFPQAPQPAPLPQPTRPPQNLAVVYQGIAMVLAARLQCLLLVGAMIVLSGAAVFEPEVPRLWAAGGFNVFALAGIALLGRRQ